PDAPAGRQLRAVAARDCPAALRSQIATARASARGGRRYAAPLREPPIAPKAKSTAAPIPRGGGGRIPRPPRPPEHLETLGREPILSDPNWKSLMIANVAMPVVTAVAVVATSLHDDLSMFTWFGAVVVALGLTIVNLVAPALLWRKHGPRALLPLAAL